MLKELKYVEIFILGIEQIIQFRYCSKKTIFEFLLIGLQSECSFYRTCNNELAFRGFEVIHPLNFPCYGYMKTLPRLSRSNKNHYQFFWVTRNKHYPPSFISTHTIAPSTTTLGKSHIKRTLVPKKDCPRDLGNLGNVCGRVERIQVVPTGTSTCILY